MSADVEKAFLQIAEQFGNKSQQEAIQLLQELKEDGRYLTDVY
jgi:sulfite reductase alpha subunit-like flavoprotein